MSKQATLLAVGDVAVARDDPASMFKHVTPALLAGDLVFGQLETTITDRGARAPHAKLAMRAPSSTARAIAEAGFDVMSFAGNHCMDWGQEGFSDTLALMQGVSIDLVGAGADIEAARKPVFAACGDATLAFLAYSSILPEGYWAEAQRPGCAPMRAHTYYDMIEPDQPGTPPRIRTEAHAGDLSALRADIHGAKRHADIVVVSLHWGIHMTPFVIADYQVEVAHAAIDAGADAILGHHPHILKGVAFHNGAPIFYSMGNFAIEQPHAFDPGIIESASFKHLISLHPGARAEGVYVLPEDTRKSMIVELTIESRRVTQVAARPVWIDDRSIPHLLASEDPRFEDVCDYLRSASSQADFRVSCITVGDRLRFLPA